MLETLYFYALAHQNDFDVSWCKWVLNQCSIAWITMGSGFLLEASVLHSACCFKNQFKPCPASSRVDNVDQRLDR